MRAPTRWQGYVNKWSRLERRDLASCAYLLLMRGTRLQPLFRQTPGPLTIVDQDDREYATVLRKDKQHNSQVR